MNLTAEEIVALTVSLKALEDTPYAQAAASAVEKVLAAVPDRAAEVADRVRFLPNVIGSPKPNAVLAAVASRNVLRIEFTDRDGKTTRRDIEPLGYLGADHWYLLAWCRLRDTARAFRIDRITVLEELPERVPARVVDLSRVPVRGGKPIVAMIS